MAKCHIACVDNNLFTVRQHLGVLHLGSGIFTTAFVNLAKAHPELKWMKD